jgi:hypothetical protein
MWLGNLPTLNYDAANAGEFRVLEDVVSLLTPFLSIDSPARQPAYAMQTNFGNFSISHLARPFYRRGTIPCSIAL